MTTRQLYATIKSTKGAVTLNHKLHDVLQGFLFTLTLWLRSWKVFIRTLSHLCNDDAGEYVFVFMVIFNRLRSFIIKNINSLSFLLCLLSYLCALMFILSSFIAPLYAQQEKFHRSFPRFLFVCAFTMLRRNHMCLIFSTISLLPTCWNLWILWRRMEGFVEQRKMWKKLRLPFFFAFSGAINALPFFAFKYYEPNITITTHYPLSYKANEMAMTKWLLCGVDLFCDATRDGIILFIQFYCHRYTHNRREFHKSFWFYR